MPEQEFARPKQILPSLPLILIGTKLRHKWRVGIDPPANAGLRYAIGVTEVLVTTDRVRADLADFLMHYGPAVVGRRSKSQADDVNYLGVR